MNVCFYFKQRGSKIQTDRTDWIDKEIIQDVLDNKNNIFTSNELSKRILNIKEDYSFLRYFKPGDLEDEFEIRRGSNLVLVLKEYEMLGILDQLKDSKQYALEEMGNNGT